MAIADTIESIEQHLLDAYDAIETKNGSIPEYKNIYNLKDAILSIIGGAQPKLHAVSTSISGNTLNITNPSTNGDFVDGYYIYDNTVLEDNISVITYDLLQLGAGSHSVTVAAYGDGFEDSAVSTALVFDIYRVSNSLTNLTSSNAATLMVSGQNYIATLSAESGYYLPDTITVTINGTPVSSVYNNMTGEINIPALTIVGDISIVATAASTPKLAAPIISLTNSVISWTAVTNATSYDIYVDGVQSANTTNVSYDLKNIISVDGTYDITVIAKASGHRDSNSSNIISFTYVSSVVLGVSGLADSTVALTRTDDAVGLSAVVNSSTGLVSSDFDNLFPWSDSTVETINGNKFVHMPDMWFRVGTANDGITITDIAVSNAQGDTGDWYKVDSFYYSCYGGSISNNKLCSVSGVQRTASKSRAQFRTAAAANGSGYFQLDIYHHIVMLFLWWIEFANKNSQSIMRGRDGSYGSSAVNTGGTDELTTPSGYNISTGQMRYHYIEDFVGNYYNFVDGCFCSATGSGKTYYVTDNPINFSDSTANKVTLSYVSPATGELATIGWNSLHPFLVMAKTTVSNSSYNTYFCDYGGNANSVILVGGGYSSYDANNGISMLAWTTSAAYGPDKGARLLYKPTT